MPAAPPARRSPADRPPFECRVRFPARLAGARIVPADAPLTASPKNRGADTPRPSKAPEHQGADAPRSHEQTPGAHAPGSPGSVVPSPEAAADLLRIETTLGEVRRAVAGLREDQAGRLREWQRAAVELAATLATRLLHDRIAAGDFPMEAKVRDMLAQAGDDPATVYLNPADLELLQGRLGGPLAPGRDDPRLVPDPGLGRGDCRVESKEAVLVSEITRELQEIRDDLLRSFGNARA
ncbi:MAG: hypothetical protein K2X82_21160 [Gemmataceae bacterium]|nr:hypothetical protein [Gemmataceae bacterium]